MESSGKPLCLLGSCAISVGLVSPVSYLDYKCTDFPCVWCNSQNDSIIFFFRDGSLCNESDDEDEDDEIFGNPAKVSL